MHGCVQVIPSKDIKVAGLLGPAARMEKKSPNIADQEIGVGGTTVWKICGMDTDTSMAVAFEITANAK
jgi:protein transport protein SEC23